nr:reverse transcriptase domain-containing protein [Tanacetum cinerariifolium]
GLRIATQMGVKNIQANVDSKLVANQVLGTYVAKEDNMIKYLEIAKSLVSGFKTFSISQVPRSKNKKADALKYVIKEIHEGSCSMHAGPRSVVAKAIRLGYFWPTMHRDAQDMIPPWPFYKWGIDIAGPFPEGPGKVKFLIVAMDYFTKWIEAKAVATITGGQVKKFVWDNIVCRFGIPVEIISDNGKQFADNPFKDWWVIGHGMRLSMMKCAESLEMRQAFADVVSAGVAKVVRIERCVDGCDHGCFIFGERYWGDAPQYIRDLCPSSSQLTILMYPKVRDPRNPWACKEEIALADAIAANISRAEKKKKCRIVCRTHGVGSAHHARSDGIPVSVTSVVPQGLALLLVDGATQTDPEESLFAFYAPWESLLLPNFLGQVLWTRSPRPLGLQPAYAADHAPRLKKDQEKDKIGSKRDKNGKRGEAKRSLK